MTLAEQIAQYGRTIEELDSLIVDSGTSPIFIEAEFVVSAAETSDVSQMIRLLRCAQYIADTVWRQG